MKDVVYPQFPGARGRRFTQDTPIQFDVWVAFAKLETSELGTHREALLMQPHNESSIQQLVLAIRAEDEDIFVSYNESHVLAHITFFELLRVILPLSEWWRKKVLGKPPGPSIEVLRALKDRPDLVMLLLNPAYQDEKGLTGELLDLIRIAGSICVGKPLPEDRDQWKAYLSEAIDALADTLEGAKFVNEFNAPENDKPAPVFQVSCNRKAEAAVWRSRLAVKADAAVLLFSIRCSGLIWAILDSGIDAEHLAFRKPKYKPGTEPSSWSRVTRTFDFTRVAELLSGKTSAQNSGSNSVWAGLPEEKRTEIARDLQRRLQTGQQVDWDLMLPFLEMKHGAGYVPPEHEHGTHVAGILAADGRSGEAVRESDLVGVCPDLELYDLRVIGPHGEGDEFGILAALQFVRYLNSHSDRLVVHGVNLSLSIPHAVDSYACGETPVCQECARLVGSGVVVVAAAGNRGYRGSLVSGSVPPGLADAFEDYKNISITDPGNADEVITVGSTHRFQPHKYGVSYFSSRGPTGDGRLKPDLVAPGEKIESCIPNNGRAALDGTSMSAPHVSGAAALLMARHRELIGRPGRIKEILCRSATDLGRERSFQGAGMLDILRALQSV